MKPLLNAGLKMPTRSEVSLYLKGLWLLILNKPEGARYLDLTDLGMRRSFFAIIWCIPSILVTWTWQHFTYLTMMGSNAPTGPIYFFRLGLVELICWLVPIILIGLLLYFAGAKEKFSAIITCANWLSVPFTTAYGVLILIAYFIPALQGVVALLFFVLLLALVISFSRITRFFIRNQGLLVFTVVATLLVSPMLISEALQKFLGIYPFQ